MGIEENKKVVKQFFGHLSAGDIPAAMGLMWEDATWWNEKYLKISGIYKRDDFFPMVGDIFKTAVSPLNLEFGVITAEEDRVALQGVSHVDLASGLHYSNTYHWLFILRDGKIAQAFEYMNDQEFLRCFPEFDIPLSTIPKEGVRTDWGTERASPTGVQASNKAIAMRFMKALAEREVEVAKDLWHEDGTWWMPSLLHTSGIYTRDQFISHAAKTFEAADDLGLMGMEFIRATAEDDRVCLQSISHSELPGGIIYSNDYHYLMIMKDGKVLHGYEYLNSREYIRCFPEVAVNLDEYRKVKKTA